jgi:hypothetical protein
MTDFERFIDRSALLGYMNEGKGPKDTKFINAAMAAMGIPFTIEGFTRFLNGISKFLPQDSPEVKAIRKFYATRGPEGGLDYMDPTSEKYIPGMENYNIVYGNIFDPKFGLQEALSRRSDTIRETLKRKYGMTDADINAYITSGKYTEQGYHKPGAATTDLLGRIKLTTELSTLEKQSMDEIATTDFKTDFQTIDTGVGEFDGGKTGPADSPPIAPPSKLNPPRQDTRPIAPPSRGFGNPPKDDDNRGGSFDTSAADKAGTSVGSGQFSPSTSRGRSGY